MQRVWVINSSGRRSPGPRPASPRIPATFVPPLPLPSRFSSSRSSSPQLNEVPASSMLSSVHPTIRKGEWTAISSHRLEADLPRDLTGQIRRVDNECPITGGYGCVWCGSWQNGTETCKVAIKVLRFNRNDNDKMQKLLRRLRKEIEVWKRLNHRNIVPLLGTTSDFGSYSSTGMVSPWMENGNLTTYLKTSLTLSERLQLLCDVAAGLEYLHSNSVIHGDLTGANILVDYDGTARLIDFGLSTIKPEFDSTSYNSSTIGGALRWIAPELLPVSGKTRALSSASDIYSLGSMILQVLSGQVPYHYLRDPLVVLELYHGRLPRRPPEPWVTDAHWGLMNQCWNRNPNDRPSIQEVKRRIITLCSLSFGIVSAVSQLEGSVAGSFPWNRDCLPQRQIGSPLFQPSPQKPPHQIHTMNVRTAQLAPTPLPSTIPSLSSSWSITPTSDRKALQPSTLNTQSGSLKDYHYKDHDYLESPAMEIPAPCRPSCNSMDDKHAQSVASATRISFPINDINHQPLPDDFSCQSVRNVPLDGPYLARTGQSDFNNPFPIRPSTTTGEYCPFNNNGVKRYLRRTHAMPYRSIDPLKDGYETDCGNLRVPKGARPRAPSRRSVVGIRADTSSMAISLSLVDTIRIHRKMATQAIRLQIPHTNP